MKSRDDSRKKQDKEISMINGQVAVMRLLSGTFLLPQNGGNRKCQTPQARSLSAGQFSGDWGCPPTSGVLFVQKDTACHFIRNSCYPLLSISSLFKTIVMIKKKGSIYSDI